MKTLFAIALLFVALIAAGCGGEHPIIGDKPLNPGGPEPSYKNVLKGDYTAKTVKGVEVKSGDKIDPSVLPIIDAGLDNLFRIASAAPYNYKGFNTHASYTVWILPRDIKNCENPAFSMVANSPLWPDGYDNDPNGWDKDPRPGHTMICVAGFMTRVGAKPDGFDLGGDGMAIVDGDTQTMLNVVRYEGEHNLLLEVDKAKFAATQYHTGSNGGHPILPDPSTGQLMSKPEFAEMPHPIEIDGVHVLVVK